jgi:hypothetical protein
MTTDARDDFDHSSTRDRTAAAAEGGGFSSATGGGTSMGTKPVSGADDGNDDPVEALEQGTDPGAVGDRDEPDLPVRTSADQPEDAGKLPLGESDIEDRLRAAQRTQHHDAGEPDAALG